MNCWPISTMVILFLCLCLAACRNDNAEQNILPQESDNNSLELLVGVNKYLTYKDKDIIEGYIKRHELPMVFYEAGYYALSLHEGTGAVVEEGDEVTFSCKVSLLDGTLLYDNTKNDSRTFIVGKTKEIKGLQIGLIGLKEEAHDLFIFPPHLAYGLIGDKDKIPPRVNLLYDIEIIKVVKK